MEAPKKEGISRRSFLKGAAVGGIAGLAIGIGGTAAVYPKPQVVSTSLPEKWDYETDVLSLGSGGTGLAAALWAKYGGAESLILEKGVTTLASCSALSDGQWAAAGTSVQKEQGIDDNPDKFFDWVKAIQPDQLVADSDLETSRVICDNSTIVLEWLLELGAVVHGDLQAFLNMDVPRWHTLKMQDVMSLLLEECKKQNVEILYETRATRLITNQEGRVIGVEAEKDGEKLYVKARKGVVLGTGGYSSNPEMLLNYNGKKFANTKPVGCKTNTGDGFVMALALGAALKDVHVPPSLALAAADTLVGIVQLPRAGGILVNINSKRYTAENIGATPEAAATAIQPDGKAFIIHDDPQMSMEHAKITLDRHVKLGGKIYTADTIEDLATQIGLDPTTLAETVATYNGYVDAGDDPEFHRNTIDELEGSAPAPKLETAPFHALEVCAAIYPTQMKLNTDVNARVRNPYGDVIPGLYAGGLMGNIGIRTPYSGQTTTALTGAFVLGYVAGKDAAAQESWEA